MEEKIDKVHDQPVDLVINRKGSVISLLSNLPVPNKTPVSKRKSHPEAASYFLAN